MAPMKRGLAGLAGLVLLAALTACGGSDPPTAPANTQNPTPTPTGPPVPTVPIPSDVSAAVRAMLEMVPQQITSALLESRENLPRNPNIASQINAKIAMLQRATLVDEIYTGRFFVEGSVASTNGRSLPVVAVFPLEQMRGEATDAVRTLERGLGVLEEFTQIPYPTTQIRLWYGFKIGNSGGGGTLFMEDRTTYEGRPPTTKAPFEAILYHELSHSYIGNEGLNQFLEVYVYNVVHTGSRQISSWNYLRGWTSMADANKDFAAVLDVYQVMGYDAMSKSYTAVIPLRPAYGEALSAAVIQVFVDRAPDAAKPVVAQKLSLVSF
jgi:hypothetical protein